MTIADTHAWVWWASQAEKLSPDARRALDEADLIGVSAISCWELSMLVVKQRLGLNRDPLTWIKQALALPRVRLLPLSPEISVRAANLGRDFHGDPADRMIVATAFEARAELVTKDDQIRAWHKIRTVW